MTRKELLNRLSRWAQARYGRAPSPRSLRDWVNEEALVKEPDFKGGKAQNWDWSSLSYRQALKVCRELFGRGAENFNDVRTELWLGSSEKLTKKVRPSFRAHYRRLMTRALRPVVADIGPPNDKQKRARRQATLIRRMGEPSPLLAAVNTAITNEQRIAAYDAARFGSEVAKRANAERTARLSDCLERLGFPKWMISFLPYSWDSFIYAFGGLASFPGKGESDQKIEGSADASIQLAEPGTFINTKDVMRVFSWTLKQAPNFAAAIVPENKNLLLAQRESYSAVADAAKHNPWRLIFFVSILGLLRLERDGGCESARIARTLIPPVQKMIAYCQNDPRVSELMNDDNPFAFMAQLSRRSIEEQSGQKSSIPIIQKRTFFQVARLLWPHGLSELHRMGRPYKPGMKQCRSA